MAERNNSETAKAEQLLTRVGGTQSGATDAVDSRLVVLQEAIAQNSAGAEQLVYVLQGPDALIKALRGKAA